MNWILLATIGYLLIVFIVCLRVIHDTRTSVKTLAYLMLVVFIPVFGIWLYFTFGVNYRKRKLYSKKILRDVDQGRKLEKEILRHSEELMRNARPELESNRELATLLIKDLLSPLTTGNSVKLLVNGEEKFPEVLRALEEAVDHIHIEYYIIEKSAIGRQIEEILIRKAKEGISVRMIYDDFGSRSIRKEATRRWRAAGIEAYPFYRITFLAFANRLNYRNHRKIIVIDGRTAFVGGINISDRYINGKIKQVYWRDTHMRIDGPGVYFLQHIFVCDWNFCAEQQLQPDRRMFPSWKSDLKNKGKLVQIAASGPDSDVPLIMYSLLQAINLATEEILITTPYFIPGESLMDALIVSALSGVKVKLLVPRRSDSVLLDLASRPYYSELLEAGVEIYRYEKGFVHAKTLVADGKLAIVGTANMDYRSFDLNFEVNAVVYDSEIAEELREHFFEDIKYAQRLDIELWKKRPLSRQLLEKTVKLVSPLL